MEYETEITERLREAIAVELRYEILFGWSLDQLVPMLYNAVEDAIKEIEEE